MKHGRDMFGVGIAAIERLLAAKLNRAKDCLLTDENLAREAGMSRSSLVRNSVLMDRWRTAKITAITNALEMLTRQKAAQPSLILHDRDLLDLARVDHAAFFRMPKELLSKWQSLKTQGGSSRNATREHAVPILVSYIASLYLAVRKRDELIETYIREIKRLGGNVVSIHSEKR